MRQRATQFIFISIIITFFLWVLLAISLQSAPPSANAALQNTATPETPNIKLIRSPNTLVIYISADSDISLAGLEFYVLIDETITTHRIIDFFDILHLTDNIAPAGSCFILEVQNTSDIPPSQCNDIFRQPLNPANNFWYDSDQRQPRDIAIGQSTVTILQTCAGSALDCDIFYATPTPTFSPIETASPSTITRTPTSTAVPQTGCAPLIPATIKPSSGHFIDSGQVLESFTSPSSRVITVGDVDCDGDLDAMIGSNGAAELWINRGNGEFRNSGQSLSGLAFPALGDLDGDGDLDAFLGRSSEQPDEVWLNDGTGFFEDTGQRLSTASAQSVALADFDGDGDLDAFIAATGANEVWFNDGMGNFSSTDQSLGDFQSRSVAAGDLDHDGDVDAFVVSSGGDPNIVWLNDGTGTFTRSEQAMGREHSVGVALADFDNDGDLDAFVANSSPSQLWLNDGTGYFEPNQTTEGWASLAVGDINGDGFVDVVGADQGTNDVYLNDNGQFTEIDQDFPDGVSQSVALGDFDNDGDLDFFLGNHGPNLVWFND